MRRFSLTSLRDALVAFRGEERASMSVETVLVLPILMSWIVASLVFYDAYRARNVNLKAAYTVSDMLSREQEPVDAAYLNGLAGVFSYLTAGSGSNASVRVTIVSCTDNCTTAQEASRELALDWSYATNDKSALVQANLSAYNDVIPTMPTGERLIMVETFVDYTPPFQVGLGEQNYDNVILTRPRFVARVCWENEC